MLPAEPFEIGGWVGRRESATQRGICNSRPYDCNRSPQPNVNPRCPQRQKGAPARERPFNQNNLTLPAALGLGDIELREQSHAYETNNLVHFRAVVGQESKVGNAADAEALCYSLLLIGIDMHEYEVLGLRLELFC